jgi:hypothetical protein
MTFSSSKKWFRTFGREESKAQASTHEKRRAPRAPKTRPSMVSIAIATRGQLQIAQLISAEQLPLLQEHASRSSSARRVIRADAGFRAGTLRGIGFIRDRNERKTEKVGKNQGETS